MNDSVSFSKYFSNTINEAQFLLSKYKDHFTFVESEVVLDIGCANGIIAKEVILPFVEQHSVSILGADISQDAVETASKLHGTERLSFQRMDIEEENLWTKYEEKFGHIFAFYLLHLLKHPDRWSKNLYKMLKPKGQFFGSVILPPTPISNTLASQKLDKSAPWYKYIKDCPDLITDFGPNPSETVCDILRRAGFTIDSVKPHILRTIHETTEEYHGALLSLNNFLKHIPEELRGDYIEDFLKKGDENLRQAEDGRYYIKTNTFSILATKL